MMYVSIVTLFQAISDLDGMEIIFKLASCGKLDVITLFKAISGFKTSSYGSGWDGGELQTSSFP